MLPEIDPLRPKNTGDLTEYATVKSHTRKLRHAAISTALPLLKNRSGDPIKTLNVVTGPPSEGEVSTQQ
jgi:hypothetical protein